MISSQRTSSTPGFHLVTQPMRRTSYKAYANLNLLWLDLERTNCHKTNKHLIIG
jgi:hypothetical protein